MRHLARCVLTPILIIFETVEQAIFRSHRELPPSMLDKVFGKVGISVKELLPVLKLGRPQGSGEQPG